MRICRLSLKQRHCSFGCSTNSTPVSTVTPRPVCKCMQNAACVHPLNKPPCAPGGALCNCWQTVAVNNVACVNVFVESSGRREGLNHAPLFSHHVTELAFKNTRLLLSTRGVLRSKTGGTLRRNFAEKRKPCAVK